MSLFQHYVRFRLGEEDTRARTQVCALSSGKDFIDKYISQKNALHTIFNSLSSAFIVIPYLKQPFPTFHRGSVHKNLMKTPLARFITIIHALMRDAGPPVSASLVPL